MRLRLSTLVISSFVSAAAFANPVEEEKPKASPPMKPGMGVGVPRASGMPEPVGVMHELTDKEMMEEMIKRGEMDARLSPHPLEPRITLAPSGVFTIDRRREGLGLYVRDDYSTYQLTNYSNPPSSFVPLHGQVNILGRNFSADPWIGVATDAVMMTVPPGAPGGVPPTGLLGSTGERPGTYVALARASGQDSVTTAFALAMNYVFDGRVPTADQSLSYTDDWYLISIETSQWWQPTSFVEGCIMQRVFFGGTSLGGILDMIANEDEVLDRFASLGVLAGNPSIGAFFAPPDDPLVDVPVGEWFQLSATMSLSASGMLGQGLWFKSQSTVADGILDPRMAKGDLTPSDFDPVGWVNLYPGFEDDPKTIEREGVGLARTPTGQLAPRTGPFDLAPPLAVISLSGTQYGEGLDPTNTPDFQPEDAFIDNTTIIGEEYIRPNLVPDLLAPFFDDFELYTPNQPMRLQTEFWNQGYGTTGIVVPSVVGSGQALAQSHNSGSDLLETISNTRVEFPWLRTRGAAGDPATVSMSLQINPSANGVSRAVSLLNLAGDATFINLASTIGSVVFGAADPSDPTSNGDGQIWVVQPNSSFDPNQEWHDYLVRQNWAPSDLWLNPPPNSPLNTSTTLVPTGVKFPTHVPFEFRAEIEPDANDPEAAPILRVFIDDAELHPNGNPAEHFRASGLSITNVSILGSASKAGDTSSMLIDDFLHDSPLRPIATGPAFALPYADDFSGYLSRETIHDQGDTPFLSLDSVPDYQSGDTSRSLTLIQDMSAIPDEGELVCRYLVDDVFLDAGIFTIGDVVAISFEDLPTPYDTFTIQNLDCPGANGSVQYVVRSAPNQPRLETGDWTIIDLDPAPFDSNLGDVTGFRFDYFNEPRWRLAEPNAAAIVRTHADALSQEGGESDHLLEVRVLSHDTGAFSDEFPMFTTLTSILPAAEARPAHSFPDPESTAHLSFDLYIESFNEFGQPDDSLAPRSRFSVPLMGVGGRAGRITTIMFGGPHVNEVLSTFDEEPPIPLLAPDLISYTVPSGFGSFNNFDVKFQSTGVSLLTGGAGLDGSIAGPLVNRWIRVSAAVNADSEWSITIDEDRDGPLPPVTMATGVAVDKGFMYSNNVIANTTGFDGLHVNQGRDIGSAGQPAPRLARIVTLTGEEAAVAPANADQFNDYCYYATTQTATMEFVDPPLIAEPDLDDGTIIEIRPISANQDVLAVLNRQTDGAGMVVGPKIHERCPWDGASGINQFAIVDEQNSDTRHQGRWQLLGDTNSNTVYWPKPAGGIGHIDGPAQDPPIAYNDPSLAPPDYPALPYARPILLATWADDEHDGWDPMPPVFPQQRWLIDNVRLNEIQLAPPCPDLAGDDGVVNGSDLAQLLAAWGTVIGESISDLNGDGVVNGSDLATLLANWGTCGD